MPKISIIVPVYKVEKYLNRCIDSILNQTFRDFELILVDDGSPDNCGAICDEYKEKDSRIVVIHQNNQGLSGARNTGIDWAFDNSDSDWITFIDSDDWIHRDCLKFLYETAIENKVGLSICNCIKTSRYVEDDEVNEKKVSIFSTEDFWLFRQYCGAWAKLHKKTDFKDIRYPDGLLYEDTFVTHRVVFMHEKVAYIENPLYYYCLRDDSITKSQWSPRTLSQLDGVKQQIRYFKKNGFNNALLVSVRNYLIGEKRHIDEIKKGDKIYLKYLVRLELSYRITLVRYRKLLPIKEYTNMYRFAFPLLTKIYKKITCIKERLNNGTAMDNNSQI